MKNPIIVLAAALLFLDSGAAISKEVRVSDRVFVVSDREMAPLEFQMVVNAGCSDEAGNQCRGLAHYLEHLILVGRNAENKDIALRFFPEAITNGWTNNIATVYWHRVPARENGHRADLEKFFEFYAARLKSFDISSDEALRERNVVLQEHDWRLGSSALARFARKFDRALMPDHPLGQWTIGTPETIRAFTVDDARAFHRRWYKRNNVWFVIKGNVDPAEVKEIAEAALRDVLVEPVEPRPSRVPPAINPRHDEFEEADVQITAPAVLYEKLLRFDSDDVAHRARMEVVASLLSGQLPGSLADTLWEKAKLTRNPPYFSLSRMAPFTYKLVIAADPITETDPKGQILKAAITTYVENLPQLVISDRSVERIRNRLLDQRKRSDGIPAEVFQRLIGWLAAGNDPAELERMADATASIKPADLLPLLAAMAAPAPVARGVLFPKPGNAP